MISDVFCKIINGELPAEKVYQDDDLLVIKDIHPQAPVHLLIMPKRHFGTLEDFKKEDEPLLGRMIALTHQMAKDSGIADKGYRLIINEGQHGGKLVPHLHVHLLGGKALGTKIAK